MSVVGAMRSLIGLEEKVVIHRLNGLRRGLRVGAFVAGAAGGGHAAWLMAGPEKVDPRAEPRRFLPAAIGGASALALVGVSMLMPNKSVRVMGHFSTLGDAVRAADDLNRATGIVRRGQNDHLVLDLQKYYDLDAQNLSKLRIGDGKVSFERLVTRDGDLLMPQKSPSNRGYSNSGAATAPLDLAGLDPTDGDAVEAALRGRQIGTDNKHNALRLGNLKGNRAGYPNPEAAAKDIYTLRGPEHALVEVGDRWFALTVDGPPSRYVAARGTAVAPLGQLHVQDTAGMFGASQPGGLFNFERRIAPFDTKEPIGRTLYLHNFEGTPVAWESTHATETEALGVAQRLGQKASHWDGYGVISAPTPKGGHHVYRLGGKDPYRGWDDDLGAVRGVQQLDIEKQRVREGGSGNRIDFQEREVLDQVDRSGDVVLVKESKWVNSHSINDPERSRPPKNPGQVLPGW